MRSFYLRFILYILVLISMASCQKEEFVSLQYEVFANSANQSVYKVHFKSPGQVSHFTSFQDTIRWQSEVFSEATDGDPVFMELEIENRPNYDLQISLDMIVRKNGSVVLLKELRSEADTAIISGNL